MRTDDFDEMKPQDTSDGIPDVVQSEHIHDEQDSFDEFDNPPEFGKGGSKSLGEIFKDNPFIKVAVVVVGLLAVVVGLVMFGGSGNDVVKSEVSGKLNEREAPGQKTTEAYSEAIEEVNQQRLDQAVREGTSTIPIQTNAPEVPATNPLQDAPPVTLDDPLAGWRASSQELEPQAETDPTLPDPVIGGPQYPNARQAGPQGPDPAAVDALAQAMTQQMSDILAKHAISGPQIIQVKTTSKGGTTAGGGKQLTTTETPQKVVEILIPAGTIVYAQTLTEANSDAPGPVLARITNGPLKGSKILGSFSQTEELLTLNFNTVVVKGVSRPINGIALDPRTTLPAVATEVDHRYLKRFILPAAARFITGMGEAIAQREQTNVTVNNDTVTSTTPDLNTRQELAAGLADGTREIADILDETATNTKVLVKVHAGTAVGILFLEPVTKEND